MTQRGKDLIVILGALTAFAPMSIDMYLPALPTLETVFNTDAAGVQLTLASFFFGFALGQMFYGPVTDRFGRKAPLYVGLVMYIAASIGCAAATSVDALIVLRFLQALGACAGVVIARAMVRDLYTPQEAAGVYSALMLVMGVAPILAPFIGGYILVWFDWAAIFWALTLFGVICLAATIFRLPETHDSATAHSLALGGVLARYGRLLVDRQYMGFALAGGVAMAGMFAYIAGSPFVFIGLYEVPAERFGWFFGANAFGIMAMAQINRLLLRRLPAAKILRNGNVAQAMAGLLLLAAAATGVGGMWGIAVPLFFYVALIGLITPNSVALAMALHGANAGVASALIGTLQFGMAAITAALVGAFNNGTSIPMAAVIAVCGCLGVASSLFVVKKTVTA